MSFSPKMAEQFNFVDSASTRFHWDVWWDKETGAGRLVFPDEFFAREIMQLFTIGLKEIELDGTETRDDFERMIQTYTNEDIMTNARIWTGFVYFARRGNTEELFRASKSRFELRSQLFQHDITYCI